MFNLCCASKTIVPYNINHSPKPLILSSDMDTIIKRILWYIPNIDSYQSPHFEIINDKKVYDDILFQYILDIMGIDKDQDVHLLSSKECICDSDWNYYCRDICTSCQKIIISTYENQSKTNNLLRCIRNCVAHGHFAIVDNYLIGFNINHNKTKHIDEKKAIVKIQPKLLLSALDSLSGYLNSEKAKTALVSFLLRKHGYSIEENVSIHSTEPNRKIAIDLFAQKDEKQYAIEIKSFPSLPYIHSADLTDWFQSVQDLNNNIIRVLLIDTSRIVKDIRQTESVLPNCIVIDIADIESMKEDDSIDIIETRYISKLNGSV